MMINCIFARLQPNTGAHNVVTVTAMGHISYMLQANCVTKSLKTHRGGLSSGWLIKYVRSVGLLRLGDTETQNGQAWSEKQVLERCLAISI